MKNLIVLAVMAVFLFGCSVHKTPYVSTAVVLDYSEYTNKGFFLSESNSVSFDYKALGSVSAVSTGGYEVLSTTERKNMQDDVYTSQEPSKSVKYGKYKAASSKDALSSLCNKAMEIGANGVINISTSYIPGTYDSKTGALLSGNSYVITGMAIRK